MTNQVGNLLQLLGLQLTIILLSISPAALSYVGLNRFISLAIYLPKMFLIDLFFAL